MSYSYSLNYQFRSIVRFELVNYSAKFIGPFMQSANPYKFCIGICLVGWKMLSSLPTFFCSGSHALSPHIHQCWIKKQSGKEKVWHRMKMNNKFRWSWKCDRSGEKIIVVDTAQRIAIHLYGIEGKKKFLHGFSLCNIINYVLRKKKNKDKLENTFGNKSYLAIWTYMMLGTGYCRLHTLP